MKKERVLRGNPLSMIPNNEENEKKISGMNDHSFVR
jgi:hypothetical protein